MDRGQFQFDNEILLEMENQPGLEIILIQPSSTVGYGFAHLLICDNLNESTALLTGECVAVSVL